MEEFSIEMDENKESHRGSEFGYSPCQKEEDTNDEEAHVATIQVPDNKSYHLSDVNLLRPNYVIAKEDLEVRHTDAGM